jgi:serine/threonine-protein kinase
MQLEPADDVLAALRDSGLFAPDEFAALERELAPLADPRAVLAHLFKRDRVTRYQLGKVLSGRAADLFIGPYVITDRLGSGGMGKVYRGREVATGAAVALKVIRAALVENPTVRGRYAREVQTAGQLNHPNIVRVLDAGEANGRVYMAMEFVDGIDLARMMREFETLAVPEACEYARQAALGLAHAHASGFVHRDVKPSNVVVAGERHLPQATERAVVKLLDLGLSRAIDPLDMVAPDLTRDHTVVGTPDYMAPEQARDSKGVDARADLYGLGCTMYFLLTGRVPFAAASGAIEKILAHQAEMPPPLQGLRPEVPAAVAEIVMKLMAKRPSDRIQTAAEVAQLLAPHARYPKDSPPVEVVPRRRPKEANTDTRSSRSTLPTSSTGGPTSSVGSLEMFELSPHDMPRPPKPSRTPPPPKAKPAPPASPPPPPPVGEGERPAPRPKPRPKPKPPARKKAPRRARPAHPALWVALALAGFAVLGVVLWVVTHR